VHGGLNSRYTDRGRLGVGAMGDVRLCEDRLIGREVALKISRTVGQPDEEPSQSFLDEARIQAQLEHPSIVPVYDVGVDPKAGPFFTMKRVAGVTLTRVLARLTAGDAEAQAQFSRRRLLTAFASVCLTIDYAHRRNVLHLDLKPGNIMLGDYGELYVLDWGVARVTARVPGSGPHATASADGDMFGSAGYVAPEQLRREPIDGRADVYALGAILFEILALQPLHPRELAASLASTLTQVDARPSARAPSLDVPPELDEICVRATALAREDRFESVRALHDAVDRYLEGDRDLERRRELATSHARTAGELADASAAEADASAAAALRTRAMGEVGRALAFDPGNTEARHLLLRLLTESPRELPPEVQRELAVHHLAQRRRASRGGAILYLGGLVVLPIAYLLMSARPLWFCVLVLLAFAAASASLAHFAARPSETRVASVARVVLTSVALGALSSGGGTMVLVPIVVMANAIGFVMQPDRHRRALVIAMSCAAILVPATLEWVGLVPRAYVFEAGKQVIQDRLMPFSEMTHGFMVAFTVTFIIASSLYFIRFRDMLTDAERHLFLHAWQLRQLVPRDSLAPSAAPK
jgi:serine/threonine-protein kinase